MSKAILTLIGLYEYDNTLFDSLILPEDIERDILINNILLEAGEFSVLYPNPDFMKAQIGYWSRKNYRTFEKWFEALDIKYDPLYNYDRTEEWHDTGSDTRSTANTSTSEGTSTSESTDNTINKISAYDNASALVNDTSSDVTGNVTSEDSGNTAFNGSDSGSYESMHTARLYGNIGVTTSQQMLEAELDIATWNLYQHITDLFLNEFCIMVY